MVRSAEGAEEIPRSSSIDVFRQRLWKDVPDAPASQTDVPSRVEAKPFGKLFGVEVYRNFLTVTPGRISAPTPFERGGRSETDIYREKLTRQGWPSVNDLFERASSGRSAVVSSRWQPCCDQMQAVKVGGELWEAWQAYHADRGWAWFPDPGRLEWVHFPAGGPDGLKDFEAAIRGLGDDDGR